MIFSALYQLFISSIVLKARIVVNMSDVVL